MIKLTLCGVAVATLLVALSCQPACAQRHLQLPQTDTFEHKYPIIPINKQKLLSNVDVIFNMQNSFMNEFADGKYQDSRFNNNQFRLEIKGQITDKVFFRFRDRYTKSTLPQSLDNLSNSTDLAYIQVSLSDRWSFNAGKLSADWGGIEFDMNPIDIYQYNDILQNSDNFLTGAGVQFKASKQHQFDLQLCNSRTRTFQEQYGKVPGITETKFPYAATATWRGSLFGDHVNTIWSYSIFRDAKSTFMYFVAAGQQLTLDKFQLAYDFKYSKEDLDRKGVISNTIPWDTGAAYHSVLGVNYMEHWVKLDYRIIPELNISFVGMVDIAGWPGNPDPQKDNHIRTSWGFIPVVEFFPYKKLNLKFFANYIGRCYQYSNYAKQKLGAVNMNTGVIEIGFVTPLHIL